jgi:ABC-type multidrug transport system fused ATPase/permease subunit
MERDPLRFVWRSARTLHVLGIALVALALPIAWIGLDLVRVAIDDAVGGQAFADGRATAVFMRYALALPEHVLEAPLEFLPGVALDRTEFILATVAGLALVAVAVPIVALIVGLVRTRVGGCAVLALRRMIVARISSARPSAREEVRRAAALAGESLGRATGFLGGAILTPVASWAALALATLYVAAIDWRLGLAMTAALAITGLVWPNRLRALGRAEKTRFADALALTRELVELGRRLPALRAHGTAGFERARLDAGLALRLDALGTTERGIGTAAAQTAFVTLLTPVLLLGAGLWFARTAGITAGALAAALSAALLGVAAVTALGRWRVGLGEAQPLFEEVLRTLEALKAHRPARKGGAPISGVLHAQGLSAYDGASGERISGIDLSVAFPAHVALSGEAGAGARVFAKLVAGQLDPSIGRLTFGGVEVAAMEPAERARRIAFAGEETILIPGSLRQNILYGCSEPDSPDLDQRLAKAAAAAGLERLVHARGLSGRIDPAREEKLSAAIVEARRVVLATLAAEGLTGFVEPFDPGRYNRHGSVAENILFGMPVGDTFRDADLPAHPFVQAILEAEGLTKPLAVMGLAIAANMVEIFADVPDGHPLFERFSFFPAAERGFFEGVLERRNERRRGAHLAGDRERLIGLAFRYVESRHRLGLLDAELEARLLSARASFAALLPTSLRPAIEFYEPDRVCAAASLEDNLLFGRIAQDRAGAENAVTPVMRRVLKERGLEPDIIRVGLSTPVDSSGLGFSARDLVAIDLARCLVRRPDVVVVEHALDGLPDEAVAELVARLRRALVGRGLVIVLPELRAAMDEPPFDMAVRFERGAVAGVEDRRRERIPEEPVLA